MAGAALPAPLPNGALLSDGRLPMDHPVPPDRLAVDLRAGHGRARGGGGGAERLQRHCWHGGLHLEK